MMRASCVDSMKYLSNSFSTKVFKWTKADTNTDAAYDSGFIGGWIDIQSIAT